MRDSLKIALGIIIGVIGTIVICVVCVIFLVIRSPSLMDLTETDTESIDEILSAIQGTTTVFPEEIIPPFAIGESVIHNSFVISIDSYEFLDEYKSEYGIIKKPPEGTKFVWVHIVVKNIGENAEYASEDYRFTSLFI